MRWSFVVRASWSVGLFFALMGGGVASGQEFKSAKMHHPHGCSQGTFFDPRNGGECWSCPRGHARTIFAVTSDKACEKGFLGPKARATFHRKTGCSSGTFFDLLTAGCWSCPAGYERSVHLIRSDKACVHRSKTVAARLEHTAKDLGKRLQSATQHVGAKVRQLASEATRMMGKAGGDLSKFAGKMADGIKEGFTKVVSWAGAAFDKAKELARATGAVLMKAAKEAWAKLKEFGKAVADKVIELVNKAVSEILKPLLGMGGVASAWGPLGDSAYAARSRREEGPMCAAAEGARFLGIPIATTASNAVAKIGLGLLADKILDKLKTIPDDALDIYKATRQRVRWAGDKVVKATSSAGASFKSLMSRVSAGALIGGTIAALVVHAASFVTGYPGSYMACLATIGDWKKKSSEKEKWGGNALWWSQQASSLYKSFSACYENEFLDVHSLDWVWDGFYTLVVTPALDIPLLMPLSIKVGALVTAAVAAAVGALTGGSGAVIAPILGVVAAIIVRAGVTFALNFILKKTPLYTDLWKTKGWPKVFRPVFKKALFDAPGFFFYDVIIPGLMGEYGKHSFVAEVKKTRGAAQLRPGKEKAR